MNSLDKVVLKEWKTDEKGICELPEDAKHLLKEYFFVKWLGKIRAKAEEEQIEKAEDKTIKIYEEQEYYARSSELKEKFYLGRHFLENTLIPLGLIGYKETEKPTSNKPRELDPFLIAQLLSYGAQTPLKDILKKETPYIEKLAESLFNKIISETEIYLDKEYNLREKAKEIGINKSTLRSRIGKENIIHSEEGLCFIKGIDLIVCGYKHKNKDYFTGDELAEMFNERDIDFKKLGFSPEEIKLNEFKKNKIIRIYNKIAEKTKEKLKQKRKQETYKINNVYEMKKFDSSKHYTKPYNFLGRAEFGKKKDNMEVEGYRFSFGHDCEGKIGRITNKNQNKKNWYLQNIIQVLSKYDPKKEEPIYTAFNSTTQELWEVSMVGNAIIEVEVKLYNYQI